VTDVVLVLAWLLFSHLVADFVLQDDWIAINKGTGGRLGWSALALHGFHVALCLVPVVLAFGGRGLLYLVLVTGSHMLVDRWKVRATRQSEREAQTQARARLARTGEAPTSGLGAAWTPWPGILFLADQALHATFLIVGWLVILQGETLLPEFVRFSDSVFGSWDRAAVHATILTGVVVASLLIVNTRGAFFFVLALVSPRELAPGSAAPEASATPPPAGYTVRVGPVVATVEPMPPSATPATAEAAGTAGQPTAQPASQRAAATAIGVPSGAPARIGAAIGALERLLIVAFILGGAEIAVGFVIAAKTIARFKQLDDRGFAEYYLLGTLASVSVAILSAEVAQAALRTLG
jgi:Protein of unknown function (DUF3307)